MAPKLCPWLAVSLDIAVSRPYRVATVIPRSPWEVSCAGTEGN